MTPSDSYKGLTVVFIDIEATSVGWTLSVSRIIFIEFSLLNLDLGVIK